MLETRILASIDETWTLLDSIGGRFFTAKFIKKDGTPRTLNGRQQVKKHTKGGALAYAPRPKGLLSVYDVQAFGYRMINVETLQEVRYAGKRYVCAY